VIATRRRDANAAGQAAHQASHACLQSEAFAERAQPSEQTIRPCGCRTRDHQQFVDLKSDPIALATADPLHGARRPARRDRGRCRTAGAIQAAFSDTARSENAARIARSAVINGTPSCWAAATNSHPSRVQIHREFRSISDGHQGPTPRFAISTNKKPCPAAGARQGWRGSSERPSGSVPQTLRL